MDINPTSINQGNFHSQAQNSGGAAKSDQGEKDKVEVKRIGQITCYMYTEALQKKNFDPDKLEQLRIQAINDAILEGAITVETAQKILREK